MGKRALVAAATIGLVVSGLPMVAPAPTASATTPSSTTRLSLNPGNAGAQITLGDSRRPSISSRAAALVPTNDTQRSWVAFDTSSPNAVTLTRTTGGAVVADPMTGFVSDTNDRRDVVIRDRNNTSAPTRIVSVDLLSALRAADSWDPAVNADGRFVAFLSNGTFGDGNGEGNERPCDDPSPDESAAGQGNEARDLNGALTDVYVRDRDADAKQNIAGSVGVYDQRFLPNQTSGTLPYCGTKTKLISVGTDERQADKPSNGYKSVQDGSVGISDSGRFVVFATTAKLVTTSSTGVVANQDGDTVLDVYVRDRDTDPNGVYDERATSSTYLVSLPTAGNTNAGLPTISADGSLIAYEEGANVRVVRLSVTNGRPTVTTVRAVNPDGTVNPAGNPFVGARPSLGVNGADGSIAYQKAVSTVPTVFTRAVTGAGATLAVGTVERSIGAGTTPQLDPTGRFVAFSVNNSVRAGAAAGGVTKLISRANDGFAANGNGPSGSLASGVGGSTILAPEVAVIADGASGGAIIGFSSAANNLIIGDSNEQRDVFQRGWVGLISVTTTATSSVPLARGVRLIDVPASLLVSEPALLKTVVSAPGGAVRSLPSGGVRSLPVGGLRSLPAGTVRSLPGGGIRSLELQSLPLGGIRSLPAGTLRSLPAGSPLDVTLAELTLDLDGSTFDQLLVGSPYAGWPLQSVTMRDLLDYVASLKLAKAGGQTLSAVQELLLVLPIFALDRDGVFLDGVSLASLFLGDYSLAQLSAASTAPIAWCSTIGPSLAALCAPDSTMLALDLGGADLSAIDLDTINVGALTPRNEVLTWFDSLVPVPQATAKTGVATYLTNFLDTLDVPWENVRLKYPAGIGTGAGVTGADLEPSARGGLATWTTDVVVAGGAPAEVTFTLPARFAYENKSAAVQCGQAACASQVTFPAPGQVKVAFAAVAGSNRVTVSGRPTPLLVGAAIGGTFVNLNGLPVGGAAGVAVTFDGDAAYDSAGTPNAVPPVAVFDRWSSGPELEPGTLYYGEIATTSGEDTYRVALPPGTPAGTKLTVRLSGMTNDLDLALLVSDPADPLALPAGAVRSLPGGGVRSLPGGAVRSLPGGGVRSLPAGTIRSLNGYVRSLPLEDVGADDPSSLPPEVLQDIPQSLPGGYVRSLSPNRDTTPEIVDTTVGVAAGDQALVYTVRVTGYNDAVGPYVLRVITDPPVTPSLAQCSAVGDDPALNDAADLNLTSLALGTTTLVLYPRAALAAKYPTADLAAIDAKLQDFARDEALRGRAVQEARVTTPAKFDWTSTTNRACSPVLANAVAGSISDEIINLAMPADPVEWPSPVPTPAPNNLQYVVIIGGDDVLPMARVQDGTEISNERDYAGSFGGDNPLARSAAAGRVLTDNLYGDLNPGTVGDAALLVPELAVGRLVETPAQIATQLDRFLSSNGQLDAGTKAVAAYDFLLDSGPAIAQNLGANTNTSLINPSWDGRALLEVLGADPDPDVVSLNAHFDHQGLLTAAGDDGKTLDDGFPDQVGLNDLTQDPVVKPEGRDLQTSLIFSVGCHSGLNVPATYFSSGGRFRDWADELAPGRADKGTAPSTADAVAALFVANTGFGYGDTDAIALSEQLMTSFSGLIGTYTAGQALVAAKQDYAGGMGTYVSYDEKVLHESTMYGLPMYQVGPPPTVSPGLPVSGGEMGASASVAASPMAGGGDVGLVTSDTEGASDGLKQASVSITTNGTDGATFFPKDPTLAAPTTENLKADRQFANGYPIVPKVQVDVTAASPGLTARGAILTGLTSVSDIPTTPKYFRSVVDLKSREGATGADEVYFPTTFQTVNRVGGPGGGEDRLVLLPSQIRKSSASGTTRTDFSSMDATVFYGEGDGDVTPPLIDAVSADRDPSIAEGDPADVLFRVTASDLDSGIWRVVVLYDTGAQGGWVPIELVPNGINDEWVGSLRTTERNGPRFIVQVVNGDGRVGTATDKGRYYKVTGTQPSLVTIIRGVEGQDGWYTDGPTAGGPVLAEILGLDTPFTSTLKRDGSLVGLEGELYSDPVPLQDGGARDGLFAFTAKSDGGGSLTTTVKVDGTAPTVTAFLDGNAISKDPSNPTKFAANAMGMLSFSCIDSSPSTVNTSGVASSTVTLPDGTSVLCNATPVLDTVLRPRTRTISMTATDKAGNVTPPTTFYIELLDTTGPTIEFTGTPIDGGGTDLATKDVLVNPVVTVTDQFDEIPATSVTCQRTDGTTVTLGAVNTFAVGPTTVSCQVVDSSNNIGTGNFTVTVGDSGAPSVDVSPPNDVQATGPTGAAVTFQVSASDVVDGPLVATCTTASGSPVSSGATFPIGTTVVTCTATDRAGNSGSKQFSVIVVDKVAPSLQLTPPANAVVEATGPSGAQVRFSVSANDAVTPNVQPTCTRPGVTTPVPVADGDVFPITTAPITVTCTAQDAAGNSASVTFQVWVKDTTAPTFDLPLPVEQRVNTAQASAVVSFPAVTATDVVSGPITATCVPASGSNFAVGTTRVTCTATDSAGNGATTGFDVVVIDNGPPTVRVTNLPPNPVPATGSTGAPVSFTVTATDTVDGTLTATCRNGNGQLVVSGSTFPIGTTTVTCSATDRALNTGTAQFTVVVSPLAYRYSGFYSPVNMGNLGALGIPSVVNGMNAGRTLPLKFEIFAPDGTELTSTSLVDVQFIPEATFRSSAYFLNRYGALTTTTPTNSFCSGKSVVPLNSVDKSSALKFSGGQYNIGIKAPTPTVAKSCYVAYARVNGDPLPGITALVQLSP